MIMKNKNQKKKNGEVKELSLKEMQSINGGGLSFVYDHKSQKWILIAS